MNVLTLNGITKYYKLVLALKNVSFTVPEGSVYGILGPNGSGKTTLLGIVTDVLRASSGTFQFFDGSKPVNEIRKDMGVLLETPNFYPYLSARQNLEIVAKIKGCDIADITKTLVKVNLFDRQHSAFKTFSLGMKQLLAIASALLGDPKIVILDEPTNGLDPEGISEIRQLIKQLAKEGKTVLIASHLLGEIEKVCTHVAILKKGELLVSGDVHGTLSKESPETTISTSEYVPKLKETAMIEVVTDDLDNLLTVLKTLDGVLDINESEGIVTIYHYAGELTPQQLNKHCFDNGVILSRLIAKNKNLESKFLEITK
ncbi:MAG: ATP-binding cassette domain-containing protein [Prevotellaceae bacterium]|jgi:ABC-2 type transport system ATP-binding protein|nr:ATP-binding cassette domain-containing protein [Prevotellaceae bacterium]